MSFSYWSGPNTCISSAEHELIFQALVTSLQDLLSPTNSNFSIGAYVPVVCMTPFSGSDAIGMTCLPNATWSRPSGCVDQSGDDALFQLGSFLGNTSCDDVIELCRVGDTQCAATYNADTTIARVMSIDLRDPGANEQIEWYVVANSSEWLVLEFVELDVEAGFDFVHVFVDDILVTSLTGSLDFSELYPCYYPGGPFSLYMASSNLRVLFRSDSSVSSLGFSAVVYATPATSILSNYELACYAGTNLGCGITVKDFSFLVAILTAMAVLLFMFALYIYHNLTRNRHDPSHRRSASQSQADERQRRHGLPPSYNQAVELQMKCADPTPPSAQQAPAYFTPLLTCSTCLLLNAATLHSCASCGTALGGAPGPGSLLLPGSRLVSGDISLPGMAEPIFAPFAPAHEAQPSVFLPVPAPVRVPLPLENSESASIRRTSLSLQCATCFNVNDSTARVCLMCGSAIVRV